MRCKPYEPQLGPLIAGRRSLLLQEQRPGYPGLGFVIASTAVALPSLPECSVDAQGCAVAQDVASTLDWTVDARLLWPLFCHF